MLRINTTPRGNIAGRRRPRTLRRLGLLSAVALLATLATPLLGSSSGFASTLDQKRAEARHIAAEIDANNNEISILDEQYNEAVLKIADLNKNIVGAQQRLKVAAKRTNALRGQVRARAAALYMNAGSGTLFPALDAKNAQEIATSSSYTAAAAARDNTLLSSLRTASAQFTARQKDLHNARDHATSESNRLANTRDEIAGANAKAQSLLHSVNSQISVLVKQAEAARQRAAEAAARAEIARREAESNRSSGSNLGFGNQQAPTNLPAPSGAAAVAVHAAEAELNKPYRFAASGPGSFDCSGLTSYAWGVAGVSMAHSAAVQYTEFPHVPISQLAPGDLVFFGSPIHHVGMFVGNGTMIEAPHTGAFVRYSSIYRPDFAGAARP
jgi:peptidoglycan DL-endopeptidase CwlO